MGLLSERVKELEESQTIAMAKKSRELQEQGFDVISLSLGEPDFITPVHIREAAKKAIDEGYTHYTPIAGFADLRKAICEKLKRENGLTYSPDQIVVSTGAKQSIANVVLSLVNPGDEVIVPTPYWVSYSQIIKIAEGKPVFLDAQIESDFKITPTQLEKSITPKTKLFIFSSPCNPTGSVYTKEELKALADVFAKHTQIIILSDEIYEYINFDGQHESLAQFDFIKDQVVIVNGVSKGYAMTGWRIGYIASTLEIAKACDKMQGQFTSGTSSISQKAALEAIRNDKSMYSNMVKEFKHRRDLVINLLKDVPGLKINNPKGAFYVFPDVSSYFNRSYNGHTIRNSSDLSLYLLNEAKVAVFPGEAFGNNRCVRISYATSEDLLVKSIERIREAMKKLS